ncbi:MAG TPA: oligosaccharide flippase family protein [Actinomycetota bacterium]|nr:oligosaccharide flippase family protein [Actinomycetota bacterium]
MGIADKLQGSGSASIQILSGTAQNVVGIFVTALGTLVAQVLISRTLGSAGFGLVTVVTQAAFVTSFLTRAGMDMAVLRAVATATGEGRTGTLRVTIARAALIAAGISTLVSLVALAGSDALRSLLSLDPGDGRAAIQAAAVGLPFLALANVWLAATRGLKIMRYTLYVFWAGQPLVWIVLMLVGWRVSKSPSSAAFAYSASWAWAAAAAWWYWRRESRRWGMERPEDGATSWLLRYAGPRAPAALFSQVLFWADLFVLTRYVGDADVGIYSAALRAGQVVVLFLTSVNLMFSPYVADLHNRGEIAQLDRLFKRLTRWTLAATLPGFLLLAVAPASVLRLFGGTFEDGKAALLILLVGQFVNIATGSVGFVLIMAGRTGWDLAVYAASLALDLGLAFYLCPRYGIAGAAAANAFTFGISNVARLALVKRLVGIQPYDRHYGRLIAPAIVSGAIMMIVHEGMGGGGTDLVATAFVGGLAYVVVYAVAGLTKAERRGVREVLAKVRSA